MHDAEDVLEVLCGVVELEEYGEVVAVGDRVERRAARRSGVQYGDELDGVAWVLDRYAEYGGGEQAVVRGEVVGIQAIFVTLARQPDGWAPRLGSARLEPVRTTAATRRIRPRIEWETSLGAAHGRSVIDEGDESFSGWLLHLVDEQVRAI